jgi:hypothetical protein
VVGPDCFLCAPDRSLVYAHSSSFFAMLGWGPIVEGFTLVAARDHVPSMFDVSGDLVEELNRFSRAVRLRLTPLYGPSIVTEHGRIAVCDFLDSHEPHCFHAHRLVFPLQVDLQDALMAAGLAFKHYRSFTAARAESQEVGAYLYYERPDESCVVADVRGGVRRQFFRNAVASSIGRPELMNWRIHSRLDIVEKARISLHARTGRDLDS